jgi:predicted DNA-binding transcriptional regulator YafY
MAKLQRWIDLIAALLRRNGTATLEDLTSDVPAYLLAPNKAALRRSFERDKVELRTFGIPIVTETDGAGEVSGYRLRRENFYLPYLSLVEASRTTRPAARARPDSYGYRSLPALAFEADELEAVVQAARRVQTAGDANLEELARSAIRKLAFDLPVDASMGEARDSIYQPAHEAGEVLGVLDEALAARKRVAIEYHAMSSDQTSVREVEPFGLFFLGSTWYLAARDGDTVKNFRVSRIGSVKVNTVQPGTPDYSITEGFALEQHARSRHAWELGDASLLEAIVDFHGSDGPTAAARRLGEPVPGSPSHRRFRVRRVDTFARWLLSFAGEAVPVAPTEIVTAYRDLARRTSARYAT